MRTLSSIFLMFYQLHKNILLFEMQSDRGRKRQKEIFHLLVHSTNNCNGPGCRRVKPGSRKLPSWSPMWVPSAQFHGASSSAFQGMVALERSGAARTWTLVWCAGITGWAYPQCCPWQIILNKSLIPYIALPIYCILYMCILFLILGKLVH